MALKKETFHQPPPPTQSAKGNKNITAYINIHRNAYQLQSRTFSLLHAIIAIYIAVPV